MNKLDRFRAIVRKIIKEEISDYNPPVDWDEIKEYLTDLFFDDLKSDPVDTWDDRMNSAIDYGYIKEILWDLYSSRGFEAEDFEDNISQFADRWVSYAKKYIKEEISDYNPPVDWEEVKGYFTDIFFFQPDSWYEEEDPKQLSMDQEYVEEQLSNIYEGRDFDPEEYEEEIAQFARRWVSYAKKYIKANKI